MRLVCVNNVEFRSNINMSRWKEVSQEDSFIRNNSLLTERLKKAHTNKQMARVKLGLTLKMSPLRGHEGKQIELCRIRVIHYAVRSHSIESLSMQSQFSKVVTFFVRHRGLGQAHFNQTQVAKLHNT